MCAEKRTAYGQRVLPPPAPLGAPGARCPLRCGRALDARGFCLGCQAAQVRCPRCGALVADGPDDRPNRQVCGPCLEAVRRGAPAAL